MELDMSTYEIYSPIIVAVVAVALVAIVAVALVAIVAMVVSPGALPSRDPYFGLAPL